MWKWQKRRHPFVPLRRPWAIGMLSDQSGSGAGHPTAEATNASNNPPQGPPDEVEEDPEIVIPPDPPVEPQPNVGDTVPFPFFTDFATGSRTPSSSLLHGSVHWLDREITFNRVLIETLTATNSPHITLACYQLASGELNDGTSLIPQVFEATDQGPVGVGLNVITVPESTLVGGFYYILYGRFTAAPTNWAVRVHQTVSNAVWHNPTGATPDTFLVSSPVTPPAALNLATVTKNTIGEPLCHRLIEV